MNTDNNIVSPAARENFLQIDSILFKDALPPQAAINNLCLSVKSVSLKETFKIGI